MSIVINKLLLGLSIVFVFSLLIGIRAVDVTHPNHLVQSKQQQSSPEMIHYMGKRRFLPSRRELYQYIKDEILNDNDEEKSHLNAKRYFLKSKRYFLNSKRDNERREEG